MGKKKKKMTPAQAAAARREGGKRKYEPLGDAVKDDGPRSSNGKVAIAVAIASIVAAGFISLVYAYPQLMMG